MKIYDFRFWNFDFRFGRIKLRIFLVFPKPRIGKGKIIFSVELLIAVNFKKKSWQKVEKPDILIC